MPVKEASALDRIRAMREKLRTAGHLPGVQEKMGFLFESFYAMRDIAIHNEVLGSDYSRSKESIEKELDAEFEIYMSDGHQG